jgi:transposase
MPRKVYPPEYRQQLVDLALAGESPEKLARRFEPTSKTIRDWVKAAKASSAPAIDKDAEIRRLQKEVEILREEREILKKAAAWFAVESATTSTKRSRS